MQYFGQYENDQIQYFDQENISVTLHNRDLWNQFHDITNEMIVTKVGRRMFPIIAVNIRGLDPDRMYTIELSFEQMDSHRWRYVSSKWQPGMKPDPIVNRLPYQHPDSPNYGRTWMQDTVSFPKVKLTNKIDHTGTSQVVLNSLHKYKPKISIIDIMLKKKIYETGLDETEFIAVTAYQNEEVKALKIRHNPFAKAFLDSGNTKEELFEEQERYEGKFNSQESLSGGPERLKFQSRRSAPYHYLPLERKSSPTNILGYPSSSNSSFDFSTFYGPIPTANNILYSSPPSLSTPTSDTSVHYFNAYYPPPSSYYIPYGTASSSSWPSTAPHQFADHFNYPLKSDENFLLSNGNHCLHPLTSTTDDGEQY